MVGINILLNTASKWKSQGDFCAEKKNSLITLINWLIREARIYNFRKASMSSQNF